MVYLWGATPPILLFLFTSLFSFFPFPSPSFFGTHLCVFSFISSSILLIVSLSAASSQVHFCLLPPQFPLQFPLLTCSWPTAASQVHQFFTYSPIFNLLFHLISIPSPLVHSSLGSSFFFLSFSLSPLFNTYLNFIFLSSSFSFRSLCSLFCSWSLFLPPHISLSVGYISDFYCKFACVTFLMDLAETLANKVPYTVSVIGQWGSHCISMFKQIDILTPSSSGWCSLLSTLAFQVHHIICEWLRDVQWLFTPSTLLEDTTFLFKALR